MIRAQLDNEHDLKKLKMKEHSKKRQCVRAVIINKMLLSCASDIKKSFKAQTSDSFDYNKQEKNLKHFQKKFLYQYQKKVSC